MSKLHSPTETELKFALPAVDGLALEQLVVQAAALARRKPVRGRLHNVYYDTPDQLLYQNNMSLRIRQTGSSASPQWVQTLKMGAHHSSALSHRAEWETAVPGADLVFEELAPTRWMDFDPTGDVFRSLEPRCETTFDRVSWRLKARDQSIVELSLDVGQVVVGGLSSPISELEIELLEGTPDALFSLARRIARLVPLLPLSMSKSQRGYLLAQGGLHAPVRALPPRLVQSMPLVEVARVVLQEMFHHFTANLVTIKASEDPEVLHQARVGWRRFRSAIRLFKRQEFVGDIPARTSLQPLLAALATMRDMDVAAWETLPMFANAYTAGVSVREQHWQHMTHELANMAHAQRQLVCAALEDPKAGSTLIALTEWMEKLGQQGTPETRKGKKPVSASAWIRQRVSNMQEQLAQEAAGGDDPEALHRIRIRSKELRYCIEALRPMLPRQRAERWAQAAIRRQQTIGASRDVSQAIQMVSQLPIDSGLAEYLRGIDAGASLHKN